MVAKPYTLARTNLSIARTLEVIEAAVRLVAESPDRVAAFDFANEMLALLPADVRSLGEQWDPGELGTPDEWARCGAYLGALDGRRRLPVRARPAGGLAFVAGYSLGYLAAKSAGELTGGRRAVS